MAAQGRAQRWGVPAIAWILLASLAFRTLLAAILPLVIDESYGLAVGRSFSLSFFDHPPLGFWSPALAESLFGASPLWIRLPTLALGTLTVWALYLNGRALGGERAGLWAAALGALVPVDVLYGVIAVPDAPLLPALLFALYGLIRLAQGQTEGWRWWLLTGLALGLGMASKYHTVLVPISTLVWMAITPSAWRWPLKPGFWLMALLTLAGLAPFVIWNMGHGWASLAFQSGRAGGGLNLANFALMAAGQMIYALPPVIVWALMAALSPASWRDPVRRLVVMVGLGPVVSFNVLYLISADSLPHWTMPGWTLLLPLVALWLANRRHRSARRWLIALGGVSNALLLVVALHLSTGLLTRAMEPLPGWDDTAPMLPLAPTRAAIARAGWLAPGTVVAAPSWVDAGELSAALGAAVPIRVLGANPHHFAFMPGQNRGGPAVLMTVGRLDQGGALQAAMLDLARAFDPNARPLGVVSVNRGDRPYFAIAGVALTLPPPTTENPAPESPAAGTPAP